MNKFIALSVITFALAGCSSKEEAPVIAEPDVSVCRENSAGGVPQDEVTYVDGNGQPCDPNAPVAPAAEAAPAEAPALEAVAEAPAAQ